MSAGRRLIRALEAMAHAAGLTVRIEAVSERAWASVTFAGARHALILDAAPSAALTAWLDALPHAPVALPGHVVADLTVDRDAEDILLTALTLEM